jgi:predicted nucleotidyltransferase
VSVSKQRFVVCVVAACLATLLASACAAKAGPCRTRIYDREAVLYGGYTRDGILHLRVAYDYDVDPEHQKAFQGAMDLWNAHTEQTRIVFEETTDALVDIRLQRGAPDYVEEVRPDGLSRIDEGRINAAERDTCAEYVSRGSYIWYSRGILDQMTQESTWLKSDVKSLLKGNDEFKGLARIYAHELGHALNLAHRKKDINSVMREGHTGKLCSQVAAGIPEIQKEDWQNAQACVSTARTLRTTGAVRRP